MGKINTTGYRALTGMANPKPVSGASREPSAIIFMSHSYLQFDLSKTAPETGNRPADALFKRLFSKVMDENISTVGPAPDGKDPNVRLWLVEFDIVEGFPIREILIDNKTEFLAKKRHRHNNNIWVRYNLRIEDFKNNFEATVIGKEWFEDSWKTFDRVTYRIKVQISDYRYVYREDDDGIYSHIETTIVHKGKKRRLKIFDLGEDFEPYPIRYLEFTGQLYDASPGSPLTLTNITR